MGGGGRSCRIRLEWEREVALFPGCLPLCSLDRICDL